MLEFLNENMVSIIVLLVLALAVFLAIRKIVKDKKAGIGSCGCKCSECPKSGACKDYNKE